MNIIEKELEKTKGYKNEAWSIFLSTTLYLIITCFVLWLVDISVKSIFDRNLPIILYYFVCGFWGFSVVLIFLYGTVVMPQKRKFLKGIIEERKDIKRLEDEKK